MLFVFEFGARKGQTERRTDEQTDGRTSKTRNAAYYDYQADLLTLTVAAIFTAANLHSESFVYRQFY